jgi:general secretion pathway protein D/MSHA biogenesis protein MshL
VPVTSELAEDIEYMEIGSSRIGLPVVNIREMSTTVTVKNNSILVLGGLISETEISDGDFLYGTENMPYLKYLFGYEEKKKVKRELIILLRPRII